MSKEIWLKGALLASFFPASYAGLSTMFAVGNLALPPDSYTLSESGVQFVTGCPATNGQTERKSVMSSDGVLSTYICENKPAGQKTFHVEVDRYLKNGETVAEVSGVEVSPNEISIRSVMINNHRMGIRWPNATVSALHIIGNEVRALGFYKDPAP